MDRIAVIADDLTGAADTGVQFSRHFEETVLVFHEDLTSLDLSSARSAARALSIYTNTRAQSPEKACRTLRSAAGSLLTFDPELVYKKVDSCLRGNPGSETEALLQAMGYEASFVAPAFPVMGRTTVHDVHLVHGVPVAQTEAARDPRTPVTESRLSVLIAGQARYAVSHVEARVLDSGEEMLRAEVDRLLKRGIRHVAFDAASQLHLDRIAGLVLSSERKILPVGSAGLAASLANRLVQKPGRFEGQGPGHPGGNHLLVCGTTSAVTAKQILSLCDAYSYRDIGLRPGRLADITDRQGLLEQAAAAGSLLAAQNLIVHIEPSEAQIPGLPLEGMSERIVEGLGVFVAAVVRDTKPAGLFLTGGDTAHAVLQALGTRAIRIHGEVVTGMVRGSMIGGLLDGFPVVTKAGAFGKPDALIALHKSRQSQIEESIHE
jgi:uncharacterized protein YgbK (DUF1537 family)